MIRRSSILLAALACLLSATQMEAQIPWPKGKKAAVILTYDDGISSQWEYAMPQLEKRGFRGTFFLFGSGIKPSEIPIWRDAAKKGHELGNHTIYHLCGTEPVDCNTSLDCLYCYTVKLMLGEIKVMNTFLSSIDGKEIHSFAYPCGEYKAGGIDYTDSLYQSGLSKYARDGSGGVLSDLKDFRPMHIPCFGGHSGMTAEQYIAKINEAMDKHGMVVFIFHGVGGNYLKIEADEHAKILDFLKAHKNEIWVDTFSNVLDYVSTLKK